MTATSRPNHPDRRPTAKARATHESLIELAADMVGRLSSNASRLPVGFSAEYQSD
jgi:hypothetical protein